jgi:hypothetical protein
MNDLEDNKEWYKRASFGQWNMYLSKLTKVARRMLNTDEKQYIQSVLGNPPREFYKVFENRVHAILSSVSDLRNRWKGHTGIVSEEESISRLKTLEDHLIRLRTALGNAFENTELILPIDGKKTKGVFTNEVFSLMGSRTPFPEKNITVNELLDSAKLYLHFDDQDTSIELLPLLMFHIKSGAFYFYTSIESSKVRWISYHYEKESVIETEMLTNFLDPFETN